MKKLIYFLLGLAMLSAAGAANAADYKVAAITAELQQPWSMVFLPQGNILVAEKGGQLVRLDPAGKRHPAGKIQDAVLHGQGGLMDLTLHPNFAANSWVYYSYTAREDGEYGTKVGRFKWRGNQAQEQQELFSAANFARGGRHFGSRLVFDAEGFMYLCLGDRGDRPQAQNLDNHFGKVLRLDERGRPAKGNPFRQNPAVFSYGHRNPQGFIFARGKLWLHEHGARGGDELNLVRAGRNYGWPVISYGRHYTGLKIGEGTAKEGMEQPLVYWDPSIAPSGMIMYQGAKFPQWRGDIFIGALAGRHLRRVDMQGDRVAGQEVLLEGVGRVREVAQNDGYIYVLLDGGQLLRLEPAG